jgi:hypothetical protein
MRAPGVRFYARLLMVVVAVVLFWWVRNLFSPPDWVEVTIHRVPAGVRHLYLIADGPEGARTLLWYYSMVFPFTSNPDSRVDEWNWNVPKDQRRGAIQWPHASRYGVLAQRQDGSWMLWWLGPGDLDGPSMLRYIFGSDRAEILLPDESRASARSQELLDHLGFSDGPNSPSIESSNKDGDAHRETR